MHKVRKGCKGRSCRIPRVRKGDWLGSLPYKDRLTEMIYLLILTMLVKSK
jgi:hypothetical protein